MRKLDLLILKLKIRLLIYVVDQVLVDEGGDVRVQFAFRNIALIPVR